MRLYHYTRFAYLPSILKDGLDTGQVCVSLAHHLNGVWLTDSSSPQGHGLRNGGDTSKLECRIEVGIDRSDPNLRRYKQWAREVGMDRKFMKVMCDAAGAGADDSTWYIYFGTIKPPFVSIMETVTGERITEVPSDIPVIRGELAPGSTLVSPDDVKAGRIDLKFDRAASLLRRERLFGRVV